MSHKSISNDSFITQNIKELDILTHIFTLDRRASLIVLGSLNSSLYLNQLADAGKCVCVCARARVCVCRLQTKRRVSPVSDFLSPAGRNPQFSRQSTRFSFISTERGIK